LATGAKKVDRSIHGAVVGQRQGRHAQLFCPRDQLGDTAGTIQQGKLAMNVQVNKGHNLFPLWLLAVNGKNMVKSDLSPTQ
jgi:hypothetical protein